MGVLTDLRDYLLSRSDLGLGQNQVFTGIEADKYTNPTICLYNGTPMPGIQTHDQPHPAVEYPNVQIIVRDPLYSKAEEMADRLYDILWDPPPYPYESWYPQSTPNLVGAPSGNARWPIGFALRVQQVSG